MHPELTIDLPDEAQMETLRRRLLASDVDAVVVDEGCELRIHVLASNRERGVSDALHAIDSWLRHGASVEFVRVHLDGGSYTMDAPRDAVEAFVDRGVEETKGALVEPPSVQATVATRPN
jgi:hypothetical protein